MFGMVSVLSILYSQFIEFLTEFVVDPFLHNVNRVSHFVDFVITLKTSTCLYVCMGVTVDVVPSDFADALWSCLVTRVMTIMGLIDNCVSVLGDVLPKLGEGVRA